MKGLEKSALSVSAVALFISDLVKNQLGPVLIKGEISNLQLRKHSAYIRFSLKDTSAKIDCLTHSSSNAAKLLPHLQDGDEVLVFAQPSYYTKYGQISFFTDEIMKLGEGIFYSHLEKLRQRLYEEGLFDDTKKIPLPKYPEKVGVVTSADGAVLQDILRVANDRYPLVQIYIFPSLVQGADAPKALCRALSLALTTDLDSIIIGRGGGSSEDLDAFNDEELVRLIASSSIPIISAVGHEVDTTLVDYAADISAPTPTGAAMILFPDKNELSQELLQLKKELISGLSYIVKNEASHWDYEKQNIIHSYQQILEKEKQEIELIKISLQESHPQNLLNKGYSIIMSDNPIQKGQELIIKTKNQTIYTTIDRIKD